MASLSSSSSSELDVSSKRRRRKFHFCGHCRRLLPKSTYYRHRELYYDDISQKWNDIQEFSSTSSSDEDQPMDMGPSEGDSEYFVRIATIAQPII